MSNRPLLRAAVHRRDADTVVRLTEGLAQQVVSFYFLPGGGDREDLVQEARIGIAKAVRDFHGHPAAFMPFAELCARRQVITAVKTATRNKHRPLNESSSIDAPVEADGAVTLAEVIALPDREPAEQIADRESFAALVQRIDTELSELERAAVIGVAFEGRSYDDVAEHHGLTDRKAVDNALQRSRRKLAA